MMPVVVVAGAAGARLVVTSAERISALVELDTKPPSC